jgi:hypothetical protein
VLVVESRLTDHAQVPDPRVAPDLSVE